MVQEPKPISKNSINILKSDGKRKMIVVLGLFLLFAFILTSILSFYVSKASLHDSIVTRELPLISDTIYSEVQKDLLMPLYISSTMANDTFLRDWVLGGETDIGSITRYLKEVKEKYQAVSSFFVSNQTRKYYYPKGILKDVEEDEPRDSWFFRVKTMKPNYEINVDFDMANSDIITIFINYKVFDFSGKFIGVTGVGLAIKSVKSRIDHYEKVYQRNIFFINPDGNVIIANKLLNNIDGFEANIKGMPGLSTITDQILSQGSSNQNYMFDGNTVLLTSRYIPELDWYLVVQQFEGESLTNIRRVLIINIIICIFVTIVVLLIVAFLINRYQQKLEGRNVELEVKNSQVNEQRLLLESQTTRLESANQRLENLNIEKDEFLSIAAHDLKSPLNGIVGLTDLILNNVTHDSKIENYAELILTSAQNMSKLISNLLNVRYLESLQEVTPVKIDLNELLHDIISQFKPIAANKEIVLEGKLQQEPIEVADFENWMYQVVSNLISNAIKFSPDNKEVEIILEQTESEVNIVVNDQGPGLSIQDQENLYKRFGRLGARPTGGEGSTGLGLYIVKKILNQLGGSISCQSDLGRGSSFKVTIPRVL